MILELSAAKSRKGLFLAQIKSSAERLMLQGITTPYNGWGTHLCRGADERGDGAWETLLLLSILDGEGHTLHLFTAISHIEPDTKPHPNHKVGEHMNCVRAPLCCNTGKNATHSSKGCSHKLIYMELECQEILDNLLQESMSLIDL